MQFFCWEKQTEQAEFYTNVQIMFYDPKMSCNNPKLAFSSYTKFESIARTYGTHTRTQIAHKFTPDCHTLSHQITATTNNCHISSSNLAENFPLYEMIFSLHWFLFGGASKVKNLTVKVPVNSEFGLELLFFLLINQLYYCCSTGVD